MKIIHLLAIVMLMPLVGCRTASYRAAESPDDYGYTSTQLQASIYRLHYQSPRSANGAQASDYALLRAAELTLQHNHLYFVILDRDDEVRNRTSYIAGRRETEVTFRHYDSTTGQGSGDAVTRVTGGSSRQYAEPRSLLLIQFVEEKKPLKGKPAYDAQYVKNAIEARYGGKNRP